VFFLFVIETPVSVKKIRKNKKKERKIQEKEKSKDLKVGAVLQVV
jgi:hypothetical protein